jgi:adenosylcobinamide kinase/adenosylcobinamide-phosphate guanylyltransferase
MRARIAAHRAARPADWQTLEAPLHAGEAIRTAAPTDWVLLDCLTLLASNIMLSLPDPVQASAFDALLDEELDSLMEAFANGRANWVIVSNEVGLGLVPPYPLGRFFRDGLGRANQRLAQVADMVLFMVAGVPMAIKGEVPKLH